MSPGLRYPVLETSNPIMLQLRQLELEAPAWFSQRELLVADHHGCQRRPELCAPAPNLIVVRCDVPVDEIVAIDCCNNLESFHYGMTFREALFCCLHGHSLTAESLTFLAGGDSKDKVMPQLNYDGAGAVAVRTSLWARPPRTARATGDAESARPR